LGSLSDVSRRARFGGLVFFIRVGWKKNEMAKLTEQEKKLVKQLLKKQKKYTEYKGTKK
jgi:hypothetical protein